MAPSDAGSDPLQSANHFLPANTVPVANDPSLASSETATKRQRLETPETRQRSKVTRACDSCKARKARCTGEQPCQSCTRRKIACRYETVYSRGKSPPPRRRTSEALDQPSHTPQSASLNGHRLVSNSSPIALSTGNPRTDSSSLETRAIRGHTDQDTLQYGDGDTSLHVVLQTHGQNGTTTEPPSRASPGLDVAGQYTDNTSGISFLQRAWHRISKNANSQVGSRQLGGDEDTQLLVHAGDKGFAEPLPLQLPSLTRADDLLALYFDICMATYRMLHRPTVTNWLRRMLQHNVDSAPISVGVGHAKAAVTLSVLAIASLHDEKSQNGTTPLSAENLPSSPYSDNLFCEAVRLTDTETGFPTLESVQARLIQVLFLFMSCRFNQAWYVFGHACQIIFALGLHRRNDRRRASRMQARDFVNEQCRSRTFWAAYTLDKHLSVVFGRPQHFHDNDIDQVFPELVNDEDMSVDGPSRNRTGDCHIEALVAHARLAQINEKILQDVYSIRHVPNYERIAASHRLGAELRNWKVSLPPMFHAINPNSLIPSFRRQAQSLDLSYCHAVMLVHRPFLLKDLEREGKEARSMASQSIAECISAAEFVLDMVDRQAQEGSLFHAFWWMHYVCFNALVVIYVWTIQESKVSAMSEELRRIIQSAERCLGHLAQATASNSPSRKYSIILQELRAEAKRKMRKAVDKQQDSIQQSVQRMEPHSGTNNSFDTSSRHLESQGQVYDHPFSSPADTNDSGLMPFLYDWQASDWLDLDSSAFDSFLNVELQTEGHSLGLMNESIPDTM
ncbi:fungal specific transcription factor domain-containing protein 17 [Elsinoe australis]|uniref:Fungal specific transcription factor domain-containing protein 17 n=1 Tax=Elsinoe australis TaxID=40998 RepID=A0A4U7B8D7_9PEZI|nr:fungal specific transcription factor domain-containing protein 17 [Elsinoe australis]